MNTLLVVSHLQDWNYDIPGSRVITAQTYLTQAGRFNGISTRVINLGPAGDYQGCAYYVSLLAEARGQQPLPAPATLGDLASADLVQTLTEALRPLMQSALSGMRAGVVECPIYFGRTPDVRLRELAARLFAQLPAPLLRAVFGHGADGWSLRRLDCLGCDAVPAAQRRFMGESAAIWLQAPASAPGRKKTPSLAILCDPAASERPSNSAALQKFVAAAEQLQMRAEVIAPPDLARLPEFDALFIRDTTHVNHYTYQAARRAALQGAVVIDDAASIMKCCNKIYLAELLARHGVPLPRTMLVQNDNLDQVIPALGLPCVLKRPDGAFSRGILKAETPAALEAGARQLLQHSALMLAQEYMPTEFDWRIGVLDRRPLFACKYFMVPGHWQILKNDRQVLIEGKTEALPIAAAPAAVVRIALQAADLIGDGFYGVDIKQVGGACYVMEINDNPNVDAGHEDHVLQDALYREVMAVFRQRIEAGGRIAPTTPS